MAIAGRWQVVVESEPERKFQNISILRWYSFQTHVMYCQTCKDLLAAYRHSVNLYSTALRKSLGAIGDDEEVERLHKQCRETNDALIAHWRQEHRNSGPSPKTP